MDPLRSRRVDTAALAIDSRARMRDMTGRFALLPWPRRFVRRTGSFVGAAGRPTLRCTDVRTGRIERAVTRFVGGAALPIVIDCRAESARYPALGDDESYTIEVGADGAVVTAATEWGVLRALATLGQLGRSTAAGASWPCCRIGDAPRFAWRGLMLDPARHFLPIEDVLRTLDGMAWAKLNVLHLHLSDDQGFRFPSVRFPRLPEIGGEGHAYRADELATMVEHAADLGIRVVPELDVPGHCTSWIAAYPEWGPPERSQAGATFAPSRRFGVHKPCLDPSSEVVYAALSDLVAEVAAIFPDRCLHIGGDEVNPAWWRESGAIRGFMAARGVGDTPALQAHFNARLHAIVSAHQRTLVGWDEIVDDALPRDAIVQSWRGAASRDRALAAGFDCVFSAGYYLDLFYPADIHYAFDPEGSPEALAAVEAGLRDDPRLGHVKGGLGWATAFNAAAEGREAAAQARRTGRVLGGEACLWSELVDSGVLDQRLWDRLPAVAERLWSRADVVDVESLYRRRDAFVTLLARRTEIDLDAAFTRRLESWGLAAREQRALAPLFSAIEPVKWYARLLGEAALRARVAGSTAPVERPYSVDTPLDRLVDALPAEAPAARAVAAAVAKFDTRRGRGRLLALADGWRKQARRFATIAARVPQLQVLAAHSRNLETLGVLVQRVATSGAMDERMADVLHQAGTPHDEMVLGVVPPLAALFDAD
jgi:hexosaminidase